MHARKSARRRAAAAAVGAMVVTACLLATGGGQATAQPSPTPVSIAPEEVTARLANGFTTDSTRVTKIDSLWPSRDTLIGVPVSPQEAAELARRTQVGEGLSKVDKLLMAAGSSTYGGSWLNPKTGRVHLATTARALDPSSALQSVFGALSVPTVVQSVERPLSELNATYAGLEDPMPWENQGVHVISSVEMVQDNVVEAYLGPHSVANAAQLLHARFGDSIQVLTSGGGLTNLDRATPTGRVYGGEYISSYDANAFCTASPSATLNGSYYVLTAAHCGNNGTGWYQGYYRNGPYISHVNANSLQAHESGHTTTCDCELIGPISPNKATGDVLVTNDATYPYTGVNSDGGYGAGTPVCFSGAVSGFDSRHCGAIQAYNYTAQDTPDGVVVNDVNLILTNIGGVAQGGDSGGPFGNGNTFMGILKGIANDGTSRVAFSRSSQIQGQVAGAVPFLPGF